MDDTWKVDAIEAARYHFCCHAMLASSTAFAVVRCVCVCVTFVNCVKTNKHIFKIFHHRVAKLF